MVHFGRGRRVGIFAGTNIDDLLVLTVLFVSATAGRPHRWEIVTGQVLGFTVLLAWPSRLGSARCPSGVFVCSA